MSGEESDLAPLRLQPEAWSQREFIEFLVDRQFIRHDEAPGSLYTWMASPREGDVHTAVRELDRHLRKLGWQASVREGEPYSLAIIPMLVDHPEFAKSAQVGIWAMAFVFSWGLGAFWLSHQDAASSWTEWSVISSAFANFALPLIGALLLASSLRRRLLLRMGMEVAHIVPGVVPILVHGGGGVVWPFGIFALFNQRQMEELPWADRRSLALASLVIPLTLIVVGLAYTIAGLMLTPLSAPPFEAAPIVVQLNPFTQIVATLMMPFEELVLRSAWLHPLALAGQSLMVFGWVLLIPVPGFPGHRLLCAILGPEQMMQFQTELSLYAVFLLAAVTVLLSTGYAPWLILFALGAWRLFSLDAARSQPLLVDEVRPFERSSRARVVTAGILALLLAFPGLAAVTEYDGWDEGLELDWPEFSEVATGEEWSMELKLTLVGVHAREVEVRAWLDPPRDSWNLTLDCNGEALLLPALCDSGSVDPLSDGSLSFHATISNDSVEPVPSDLVMLIDDGHELKSRVVRLSPASPAVPAEPYWSVLPEFGGQVACVNLTFSEGHLPANLSTSALTWSVQSPSSGGVVEDASEVEVCLSAPDIGRMTLARDEWGAQLPLTLTSDDGATVIFPLRIAGPLTSLVMPVGGWSLDGKVEQTPHWLAVGSHVAWGEGPETCTDSSLREPGLVEGTVTWVPESRSEVRIPDVNADVQMSFDLPEGIVSSCDSESIPPMTGSWSVASGPPVVLLWDGVAYWEWAGLPLESGVYELSNLGNETVHLLPSVRASVDADPFLGWGQATGVTIPPGGSALVNLTHTFDPAEVLQVTWLSLDQEASVGNSFQLNFAAWCLQGADNDQFDGEVNCVVEGVS